MANPSGFIRMEQVEKVYPMPAGPPIHVLKGVDLEIGPGEAVAVVGPSGSGKSTLLNIIGAMDRPTKGRIWLADREVTALNDIELAKIRNRELGFVFQLHHLLPQCTVLENVLLPTIPYPGNDDREDRRRAQSLLDRVGLGERMSHLPGELSGGERQRAALVRALINRPKVLLADEPTGSLDRNTALHLMELLMEINREERTALIVVTHAWELAERMERRLELRDGLLQALPTSG